MATVRIEWLSESFNKEWLPSNLDADEYLRENGMKSAEYFPEGIGHWEMSEQDYVLYLLKWE